MTPKNQLYLPYLPAIAEHAKEWVEWRPTEYLRWIKGEPVRETELLQLVQWIEERENLNTNPTYSVELMDITGSSGYANSARWHERWQAICKVKRWKPSL
jgi:hypothetical protein